MSEIRPIRRLLADLRTAEARARRNTLEEVLTAWQELDHERFDLWIWREAADIGMPLPTQTDTRQAVDAARDNMLAWTEFRGATAAAELHRRIDAFESAVRADERARLRAEIGAASQDAAENRP